MTAEKALKETLLALVLIWLVPLILLFQAHPYLTSQESLFASYLVSAWELVTIITGIPFLTFEYLVYYNETREKYREEEELSW